MEYLAQIGISANTIDFLKNDCLYLEMKSIINCKEEIESSIFYLREIGVNDSTIEEILKLDFHVLVQGRENIEEAVNSTGDPKEFAKNINNDVEKYIEYL